MTKKFKFEDLQPHVDMLCDALENRGASSSGIPNAAVFPFANKYRNVLEKIRNKTIAFEVLIKDLEDLKQGCLEATGNNQRYRINNLVEALDIFILKEYSKINGEVPERPKGAVC